MCHPLNHLFKMRTAALFLIVLSVGCNDSEPITSQHAELFPMSYKIAKPEDPSNVVWDVCNAMADSVNFYEDHETYRRTLKPATKGQIAVCACIWYLTEVRNGGHVQFFYNDTGMVWQDALDGLARIGAEKHHAILKEVVAAFSKASPSFDSGTRRLELKQIDRSFLRTLDQELFELDENLEALIQRYITENPSEFFLE